MRKIEIFQFINFLLFFIFFVLKQNFQNKFIILLQKAENPLNA